MLVQSQAGALPRARQSAGTPNNPGGSFGELLLSELNPQYYQLVKAGLVFGLSVAAINPTAFSGGAAGTPIFGLYNPANSGFDLVLLSLTGGYRNTGTAAANASLAHFIANQGGVVPTGAASAARNQYSAATSGSAAYAMVNTANTGAVASNLTRVSGGVQALAAAAQLVTPIVDDIKGAIIVPPGGYYAFGQTAALTGGSLDAALIWAEIPN